MGFRYFRGGGLKNVRGEGVEKFSGGGGCEIFEVGLRNFRGVEIFLRVIEKF